MMAFKTSVGNTNSDQCQSKTRPEQLGLNAKPKQITESDDSDRLGSPLQTLTKTNEMVLVTTANQSQVEGHEQHITDGVGPESA